METFKNNVLALAATAKLYGVPTILTTSLAGARRCVGVCLGELRPVVCVCLTQNLPLPRATSAHNSSHTRTHENTMGGAYVSSHTPTHVTLMSAFAACWQQHCLCALSLLVPCHRQANTL